jgi:hypothetical protein
VLAALAFFGLLASTSIILTTLHLHLEPVAATSSHGVPLLTAPRNPPPVALPAVAQPIDPGQPPASLPAVNSAKETAEVAAEDARIRVLLHEAVRTYQPEVIAYRGALPTLVLPAGSHVYTAADLVQYGALIMLANKSALLLDNIFVSTNAQLSLGSPTLDALYMHKRRLRDGRRVGRQPVVHRHPRSAVHHHGLGPGHQVPGHRRG